MRRFVLLYIHMYSTAKWSLSVRSLPKKYYPYVAQGTKNRLAV